MNQQPTSEAFAKFQSLFSSTGGGKRKSHGDKKMMKKKKRKRSSSKELTTLERIKAMIAKEEQKERREHDGDDTFDGMVQSIIGSKRQKRDAPKRRLGMEVATEATTVVQIADPYADSGDFKQFRKNAYFVDNEFEMPLESSRPITEEDPTALSTVTANSLTEFDIYRSSIDFERKKDDIWFNHLHKRRTEEELIEMVGEYLSRHAEAGDDDDDEDDEAEVTSTFELLVRQSSTENAAADDADDDDDDESSDGDDSQGKMLLRGLGDRIYTDTPAIGASLKRSSNMMKLLAERDLVNIWHDYLKDDLEEEAREEGLDMKPSVGSFRDSLQRDMFNVMNDYRDLFLPVRSPENERSIIEGYVLHIANHLLKSKRYEWYNEEKRKIRPDYKVKDSGFNACRILVLVPFRNTAFKIVQLLSVLIPKLRNVRRQEAFELTFSEIFEEKERLLRTRPKWWRYIFDGSSDDNFVLGLKLNVGQLEIMCKLSEADIIIATPLGIKSEHKDSDEYADGGDNSEDKDSDDSMDESDGFSSDDSDEESKKNKDGEDFSKILSSVEVCVVDQCDVISMQNWEHLVSTFEIMNVLPTNMRGVDFTRVRDYFIHGYAANFRQTIMISDHTNPVINGLFNSIDFCCNVRGKIRVRNRYPGVLAGDNPRQFPITIPQVFERLECDDLDAVEDYRFQYFTEELFTRFKRSPDGVFLIVVPNYIDFVRVRNFLLREGLPFLAISENQSNHVKALRRFAEQQGTFLLYTERHFFYYAPRLRLFKVNQIVFYKLPEYTFTYTAMLAKAQTIYDKEGYRGVRVTSLFSVFDALNLERIAGTERCRQLLQSSQSVHVIENDAVDSDQDDEDESSASSD